MWSNPRPRILRSSADWRARRLALRTGFANRELGRLTVGEIDQQIRWPWSLNLARVPPIGDFASSDELRSRVRRSSRTHLRGLTWRYRTSLHGGEGASRASGGERL